MPNVEEQSHKKQTNLLASMKAAASIDANGFNIR